jgi:hypothetical protein
MLINGRYQTSELLGQGAFAQTWAARDAETGAEVVVKVVSIKGMPDWKPLELFEREAAVLRSVRHPGVPRLVDAFQTTLEAGGPALVLVVERIPGESLLSLIQRGHRWPEEQARHALEQLLGILDHLHRLSPPVIHRDIKPSNVIIRPDGEPVLVDFGAVHDLATRMGHHSLTVVGTVGYLSPEQAMGAALPASDLFALGATMVHVLTHCHPADLPRTGLRLQFAEQVGCSPDLIAVLQRLLEPDVSERYQHARQVLADLRGRPSPPVQALDNIAARSIALPIAPRAVTRGASLRIEALSFLEALETAAHALPVALFGWAGVWGMGGASNILVGAGATGLSIVTAAAMVVHGGARRRLRELYQTGVAVQGQVRSVRHLESAGERYADVRYTYEASGTIHWGEIHCSGVLATMVAENDPVLVVHDRVRPRQHIGQLV